MQTIIQILKLNELRSGNKDGRDWKMQDAECILLNDDGSVGEVGVCSLPKDLIGNVSAGHYTATFTLRANKGREGGRRIEAQLVGLTAIPPDYFKRTVAPAPKGA